MCGYLAACTMNDTEVGKVSSWGMWEGVLLGYVGRCPPGACGKVSSWGMWVVTYHQHITNNAFALSQKGGVRLSQVVQIEGSASNEVLWLSNVHPEPWGGAWVLSVINNSFLCSIIV